MPEKFYEIHFDESSKIVIYFETDSGTVSNFVIKLLFYYKNSWREIQRYDCYHDNVHKDVYNKKGLKTRQIMFPLVDFSSGLNMAVEDFKSNYESIIWRFLYEK